MQLNSQRKDKASLVLNFAPIDFEDVQIRLGVFTYRSKEQLQSLREQYSKTHLFYRDSGSQILSIPKVSGASIVGETSDLVNLKTKSELCAFLIRESLKSHLHNLNREILRHDPITFVASGAANDIFMESVAKFPKLSCPDWLKAPIVYDASVRIFNKNQQAPFIGLALNLRTIRRITKNCAELIADGFPLIGNYVARKIVASDSRIAPRLEAVGRIRTIQGNQLELDDARNGYNFVNANEVFLEARSENFDKCLSFVFNQASDSVKQIFEQKLANLRSGPTRLDRLQAAVNFLAGRRIEMIPGLPISIQGFLDEDEGDTLPNLQIAPKPTYVYNPNGNYTDIWNDRGLNRYGPYTSQTFTPSRIRVAVICQNTRKGSVDQFLHKFFNGLEIKSSTYEPYAQGFIRKYMLEGFLLEFFQIDRNTPEAYRRAARQIIEFQTEKNQKWDVVLVQIEQNFNDLYKAANPYLVTKAIFLQHQIPVQAFEIESAELPDKQLVFVLNNMALATYAKLNGIPWMLKANPTITHELVIGLGSAQIGEGRFGDRQRVVGITTVFTSDGNYWLTNLSRAVPYAEYKDELLSSLQTTVSRIQRDMNWQQGDYVRLVFHSFKPLKGPEIEAVKILMQGFSDYDTEYAFLHIAQNHPYLVFDRNVKGVWDYETKTNGKGKMAPLRGLFFHLSNSETLLSVTGPNDIKRSTDGLPQPILLSVQKGSTFNDMNYLARQVFAFSCHSWRSFFPASMPVTILYSDLIAKMLGQLEGIPGWSPDALIGRIGRTRWFL